MTSDFEQKQQAALVTIDAQSGWSEEQKTSARQRVLSAVAPPEPTPALVLDTPKGVQAVKDLLEANELEGKPLPEGYTKDQLVNSVSRYQESEKIKAIDKRMDMQPLPQTHQPQVDIFREMAKEVRGEYSKDQLGIYGTQENPTDELVHENARQAGIDVSSGWDVPLFSKEGVARLLKASPTAMYGTMDYYIRKDMDARGIDFPETMPAIVADPYTGKPMYYKPTKEGKLKFTLIDPQGADKQDAVDFGVEVPRIALETVAAMGGYAAGGGGPAGVTLAATAAGVSSWGYTKVLHEFARQMGIPPEAAEQINDSKALYDGLWAFGGEGLAGMGLGMYRLYQNKIHRPLDLTPEQVVEHAARMKEALIPIKDLEAATGLDFEFGAGVLTRNPRLLDAEGSVKKHARDAESSQINQAEISNRLNTRNALDVINGTVIDSGPVAPLGRSTGETAEAVQGTLGAPLRDVNGQLLTSESTLDEIGGETVDLIYRQGTFADTQQSLFAAGETARLNEQLAWEGGEVNGKRVKGFRDYIEVDRRGIAGIHLDNGRGGMGAGEGTGTLITQTANRINRSSKGALSATLERSQNKFLKDLGFSPEAIAARNKGAAGINAAQESEDPLMFLAKPSLDMRQLHILLSELKRNQRLVAKGVDVNGWAEHDLRQMISAIETQVAGGKFIRNSTKGDKVLGDKVSSNIIESWNLANNTTRNRADIFKQQATREMIRSRTLADGSQKLIANPARVRDILFRPNDAGPLADALEGIGANPSVRSNLADELEVLYKQKVFIGGKARQGAHTGFINDYQDHMDMLFGVNGRKSISNAGDLFKEINKLKKTSVATKSALEKAYGLKQITQEKYRAGNIVQDIFAQKLTTTQTARLKADLSRVDPALWADVQKTGQEWLSTQLRKSGGLEVNASQIDSLLTNHSDKLRVLYGAQYVKNLGDLHEVTKMIELSKFAKGPKDSAQPAALQLTRALLGPLSKQQRFISAVVRIAKNKGNEAMRGVLTDPEKLSQYVRLQQMSTQGFGYVSAANAVLGSDLFDDNDVKAWVESGDPNMARWVMEFRDQQASVEDMHRKMSQMQNMPEVMRRNPDALKKISQSGSGTAMDRERQQRGLR